MAKKTYEAVTAIDHDNERFDPGAPLDLEDKHARPLLDVGAIKEVAKAEKADKK